MGYILGVGVMMATVPINPQTIEGKWKSGKALDFHTTSSTPLGPNEFGHMQFDTVRPAIADLLYQLKYKGNQDAAQTIIETASNFLRSRRHMIDVIVPVPPSKPRSVQPVLVLAAGISEATGLPMASCVTTTRSTTGLKNVTDPEQRRILLEGLYRINTSETRQKRILLFDDLFRSGATMNAITEALLTQGQAASVYALTITRTRSRL
jgi:predicted amidophosphoribosyltransferase